jgi:hypothetical protein
VIVVKVTLSFSKKLIGTSFRSGGTKRQSVFDKELLYCIRIFYKVNSSHQQATRLTSHSNSLQSSMNSAHLRHAPLQSPC